MRILMILTVLALPLAACKTTVQDKDTKVSVENGHYDSYGRFCPPGQAKKGNC
ncbi:MAG: hypothetical protein ACPGRX_01050 [Bdellovibrionales bacterium]